MDKSIFTDKTKPPSEKDLVAALGKTHVLWDEITAFVLGQYPAAILEWSFPGEKYGWSFRIKDKKRAIIYLLPRDNYFKAAFVFGQKAVDAVNNSTISAEIKKELAAAKVYAEGRGIRLDVTTKKATGDIKRLAEIKLAN
jgi:Protein of unknown function (DUF3788)